MTYDEVSKIIFNLGFTDGIRNVRKMQFECGKFIIGFKDEENIDEAYLSVSFKNCSESLYAVVIKETDKDAFASKLERTIDLIKPLFITFNEQMIEKLKTLKEFHKIESWS
jgi:hypothetical protein